MARRGHSGGVAGAARHPGGGGAVFYPRRRPVAGPDPRRRHALAPASVYRRADVSAVSAPGPADRRAGAALDPQGPGPGVSLPGRIAVGGVLVDRLYRHGPGQRARRHLQRRGFQRVRHDAHPVLVDVTGEHHRRRRLRYLASAQGYRPSVTAALCPRPWAAPLARSLAGPASRLFRTLRPERYSADRLRGVFPVGGQRPVAATAGDRHRAGRGAVSAVAGDTAGAHHLAVAARRL